MSDRDLLRRTRLGDAEAFGAFYREYRGPVLGFLRVRVPSAELAADLMCETFTQALVAVHDADRDLPVVPIAWLLTIARNLLVDAARRGRVEDETRRRLAMQPLQLSDQDLMDVEQAAADADVMAELRDALSPEELGSTLELAVSRPQARFDHEPGLDFRFASGPSAQDGNSSIAAQAGSAGDWTSLVVNASALGNASIPSHYTFTADAEWANGKPPPNQASGRDTNRGQYP